MNKSILVGDRVRLRVDYSARVNRSKTKKIDWTHRQGTVIRVGKSNDMITVIWDDRKSQDQWPSGALERVQDLPRGT